MIIIHVDSIGNNWKSLPLIGLKGLFWPQKTGLKEATEGFFKPEMPRFDSASLTSTA